MAKSVATTRDVFLFAANVLGYVRLVCGVISIVNLQRHPKTAVAFYVISEFLDVFDGTLARVLNQESRFGAMLDMLTDQCVRLGFVSTLACLYPDWTAAFLIEAAIDIGGHWLFMTACYVSGQSSHKKVGKRSNVVIRLYYTSKPFLISLCFGNELFFCSMYMLKMFPQHLIGGYQVWKVLALLGLPFSFAKFVVTLLHVVVGAELLAQLDVNDRIAIEKSSKTQ